MSSAALLAIIEGHVAVDDREREALRVFRNTVAGLADPCNEHADPTHVTASALVVARRGTVLHLHKRLNIWLQPGGHIELGEDPAAGALREATEETGLVVSHPAAGPTFFHLDVHPGPRGHTHLDLRYLLLADGDADPAPAPGESQHVRWFSWGEAAAVADAGLVGAVARAQGLVDHLF